MNPRATGLLLIVALGLAAFVYFHEIRGGEERLDAEEQSLRLFPGVEAQDVEAIWLYAGHGVTRVEREADGWRLVSPVDFPGDDIVLDGIASALAQLSRESVIDSPQAPEVYGLGADSHVIYFTAKGSDHGLRLGNRAPVGEGQYVVPAAQDPAEKVFTVASWRVNAIQKDLDDIRDKRVLDFDRDSVDQIVIAWEDTRVELVRQGEGWHMRAPVSDQADASTVDRLLSDLAFMRAEGFEDDPPPDDQSGLDEPFVSFELRLGAGRDDDSSEPIPTRKLELAGFPVDQFVLARGASHSLYEINLSRLDDFPREVVAYRDKDLANYDPAEAFALELRFQPEGAAQAELVRVEKGEEGWAGGDPAMSPVAAENLVNELAHLEGSGIVADSLGEDEAAALGFAPARVSLVVLGRKSQAGFGVRLAEVEFGLADPERGIIARRPEGRKIYSLDWALAEFLPVSLEAYRNRFLAAEIEQDVGAAEEAPPAS